MMVLSGASMMAAFAMVSSVVQLNTADGMRGRVMSVYNVAFRGGMPMGDLFSGWLIAGMLLPACFSDKLPVFAVHGLARVAPVLTAPVVIGLNGSALILVALFFFVVHRRVATL